MSKENVSSAKDVKEKKENIKKETKEPAKKKPNPKDKKIDDLEKMVKTLAEQNEKLMQLVQSGSGGSADKVTITSDDIMYSVSTLLLDETMLISTDGSVRIKVMPNQVVDISQRDLRDLFKKNVNKELFTKGVCKFVDNSESSTSAEEAYKKFRIKVENDLSEETVIDALENKDEMELTKYLDKMTDYKSDLTMMHTLLNIIMGLDLDKKLNHLSRVTYDVIEKYFQCTFAMGTMNLQTFRQIRG